MIHVNRRHYIIPTLSYNGELRITERVKCDMWLAERVAVLKPLCSGGKQLKSQIYHFGSLNQRQRGAHFFLAKRKRLITKLCFFFICSQVLSGINVSGWVNCECLCGDFAYKYNSQFIQTTKDDRCVFFFSPPRIKSKCFCITCPTNLMSPCELGGAVP